MKIRTQVVLLATILVVGLALGMGLASGLSIWFLGAGEMDNLERLLISERRNQLRGLVDNAFSVVSTANFYTDALKALENMRYGKDNMNYFFVLDADGVMLMHPVDKELELAGQLDLADADGRLFIKEIIGRATSEGQGFIQYRWPKPGEEAPSSQLAYFRYYPDWQWTICTGLYLDDIQAVISVKKGEVREAVGRGLAYLGLTTAMFTLLALFLGARLAGSISRPISEIGLRMEEIARGQGDLTQRIETKAGGEIGVLSSSFNVFAANLNDMMVEAADDAMGLAQAAGGLEDVAGRILEAADQALEVSRTAGGAVGQASENMVRASRSARENAEHTLQMSAELTQLSGQVQRIDEAIVTAGESTRHTNQAARAAAVAMGELNGGVAQIGAITADIEEISETTKLLALNATIEAARAGEAGKGFAVVAGEVKELARKTVQATDGIKERIASIQAQASQALARMEGIVTGVGEVDQAMESLAGFTEFLRGQASGMSQRSQTVSMTLAGLSRSADQTLGGVEAVGRDVANLDLAAGRMRALSREVSGGAQRLGQASSRLKGMLGRLKVERRGQTGAATGEAREELGASMKPALGPKAAEEKELHRAA